MNRPTPRSGVRGRRAPSRALRRSAVGVPVAVLGFGGVLWVLGLTPLPAAPAALSDAMGMARRAAAMGHGMAWQSVHVPRIVGWIRAHLPGTRRGPER